MDPTVLRKKPLLWAYEPSFEIARQPCDIHIWVVYAGYPFIEPGPKMLLQNVYEADVQAAGKALLELEQIRWYESEGGEG